MWSIVGFESEFLMNGALANEGSLCLCVFLEILSAHTNSPWSVARNSVREPLLLLSFCKRFSFPVVFMAAHMMVQYTRCSLRCALLL